MTQPLFQPTSQYQPRHFPVAEFDARRARAVAALRTNGLDAILLFAPESQYWLTGYDSFGFAMFQCLILTAQGDAHLLTRAPDRLQALQTSVLTTEQVHVWPEYQGADPVADLIALLSDLGVAKGTIGFESRTAGLTDYWGHRLRSALPAVHDASDLFPALRRTKSEAEITMYRRAAALSDDALDAARAHTHAGAHEADIAAAMHSAVLRGGGDLAGNDFIIGSGAAALLCRSASGRRRLDAQDQLTLEWSGTYARYHAAMMHTLVIGDPDPVHQRMFDAARDALVACEAAIRPGAPMGDVFDAHAQSFDTSGFGHARLQACGYGMGAVFAPIWVDFPMFYEGNPTPMQR
ncbi:MAG: M24 family metallopeptidase, partial [Primorskyibacter sp.]